NGLGGIAGQVVAQVQKFAARAGPPMRMMAQEWQQVVPFDRRNSTTGIRQRRQHPVRSYLPNKVMVQEKTLHVGTLHAHGMEADSARGGTGYGITHFQWLLECDRPGIAIVSRRPLHDGRHPILDAHVRQAQETLIAELNRDGKSLPGPEAI